MLKNILENPDHGLRLSDGAGRDRGVYSDIWTSQTEADVRQLQGPVLVLGASGFIGSKLFYSLSRIRPDVVAATRFSDSHWRLMRVPPEKLVTMDITDPCSIRVALNRVRPRTIFNLAAYGAYEGQADAHLIHDVNYFGTLNLISALMEMGIDAYVGAGSSSEYGLNCSGPAETAEPKPNSDYAVSKLGASYLLQYYGKFRDFPCTHLRLYSVYGPWEDRGRLIPVLVREGLVGKLPPFAHSDISRDFVYVDDSTRAFVRAALTTCRNDRGLCVNIATGIKTSLREIAGISKDLFGITDSPRFGIANRHWDLSNWYGSPELAIKKLGWEALTTLAEGLKLTVQWEKMASSVLRFPVSSGTRKKLSVIVACYRDHQAIKPMHRRLTDVLQNLPVDYEIIFVNDGSPADDEKEIMGICRDDSHVFGISHSRNFGSQAAFLSGMEFASGDAVVVMDGDLQDPPEVIADLHAKWTEGAEVAYGQRIKRDASLHMQVFYKLFYRLFRYLAEIHIPVDAGDFSLMDRKVVRHILRFQEKDMFLRGLRAWVGFSQVGVAYVRPERPYGRSTNNLLKNIAWAKKGIFSFSTKPLDYIQRGGFAIFFLSMALSCFYLVNYWINPPTQGRGITTIVLLTLGMGGLQLFSLSILGDYLGKVLEEVKSRPRFIRNRILRGQEVIDDTESIERLCKPKGRGEIYG